MGLLLDLGGIQGAMSKVVIEWKDQQNWMEQEVEACMNLSDIRNISEENKRNQISEIKYSENR